MDETAGGLEGMGPSERDQRGRKHIFAVNGASEFLEAVRLLFEDERYNVTTTNYVPKTFEQIAALEPDLIMIDLAVSVRSGWDLLERLHADAQTNRIPVVVVSTDRTILKEAQAAPLRYGGDRFLAKPFDVDDMLDAVRALIGRA
jgi:CheY-like chemotaxis protein